MSTTIHVTALKPFAYHTTDYRPGDPVAMSPLDASIYARRGLVSLTRKTQPPRKSRRQYRRRDLRAEP